MGDPDYNRAMPQTDDTLVRGLLAYLDASPTPYHAVASASALLERAGFRELKEAEPWQLEPGARVQVSRGDSSLAAFVLGSAPARDAGFLLVGAHTDSPNLRVKPLPDVRAHGYHQLAVEPYGGLLHSTWLDRDLSIAGRVLIDDGSQTGRAELVDFERPLLRIPNLAIHLNRSVNSDGLKLNAQQHLVPVLGLESSVPAEQGFVKLLGQELARTGRSGDPAQILGFDLCLYDTQRAALAGVAGEFIHGARLDNLASCYAAVRALTGKLAERPETRGIVLYDHEEVGSKSAQGAGSPFLQDLLTRLVHAQSSDPDALPQAIARSFLISADMAHAVHPNYADKHEPGHKPVLGQGPVIKTNVGQSYASDGESVARLRLLCRKAGVTPQQYVVRSDLACGSTIGPITAGRVGLRTVDIGSPLLSMHSIREMAATADVGSLQAILATFF
jgi:aspartyl aminopeptidase